MDNIVEKIYISSLKFLDVLAPEEACQKITEEAIKLAGGDDGSIVLKQGAIYKRIYSSTDKELEMVISKKSFEYQTVKKQTVMILDTTKTSKAYAKLKHQGIKSVLLIPLSYKKKGMGVLVINSHIKNQFSKLDLSAYNLFGSMASIIIRKTQLYDETRKALEVKDLFIALAAHEFRTPLTTINGYVQLLHQRWRGKKMVETPWIEQLLWECQRLTTLTGELLTLNRIKAGQFVYVWKECDIRELLDRAFENLRFIYPRRILEFHDISPNKPAIVTGDYDKLVQVINNLLDNAVKFSPVDTPILVKLNVIKKMILLTIEDSGFGISKVDLPKVFEAFYKSQGHQKTGMGLGLYLTKYIIQEHHGSIRVSSKQSKGTSIQVELPAISYG